jgi:hypothetical protein
MELGTIDTELTTLDEFGVKEDDATDEAGTEELRTNTKEELETLEDTTGVAEDTGTIVELDVIELADTGKLLIKLETNELGVIDEELIELNAGTLEIELAMLERLFDVNELKRLLTLELILDSGELIELRDDATELLTAKLLNVDDEVSLETDTKELDNSAKLELLIL